MIKKNMNGIHIIADLHEVDFSKINIDENKLRSFIKSTIAKNNLTQLGDYFHTFENSDEITGVIALAESHLSIHTWPEKNYISLDIFVCNLVHDNTQKAERLYEEIIQFLKPGNIEKQILKRK